MCFMKNEFRFRAAILMVLALALMLSGCGKRRAPAPGRTTTPPPAGTAAPAPGGNANLIMGNPSNATSDPSNKDNYLIENSYFALSYNSSKGAPNWVSWRLVQSDIGDAPRVPFYPDTDLPESFQVVRPTDYTGSGFDRGHMCPHQDRSADEDMSTSTFVMTNIVPQSPTLNQQTWERLESYCRDLAGEGKVLYIIDGPSGKGGEGRFGFKDTIGEQNTVTVPSKCWKVILVLPGGEKSDLQKVNRRTRIISVIMPNEMNISENWADYRVSVADVEKLTGYTFFNKMPEQIIAPLKKKVDKARVQSSY